MSYLPDITITYLCALVLGFALAYWLFKPDKIHQTEEIDIDKIERETKLDKDGYLDLT